MNDFTRPTGVSTNVLHRPTAPYRNGGPEGDGSSQSLLTQEFGEPLITVVV
jgi:hypothetical protein